MSERELNATLQELRDKNIPVYSISRIDSINNCLYGAYLTYVKGDRGEGNIYSYLGSKMHDTLENIMNDKAQASDLAVAMNTELDDMDLLGIEFPNESIRNNWIKNMEHFCATYKKPEGKFVTEQFFLYKTKAGNYLQGYIDLQQLNDDGTISIVDYKTSSMYSGAAIKEHGRQLLLYAMGKIQEGYKVKSIAWNFLKYCNISFFGYKTAKSKKKTNIVKLVERRKIAKEIAEFVISDLREMNYDSIEIESIMDKFRETNDFSVLPMEISFNYNILPGIVEYELTPELMDECENYIDSTIKMWNGLSDEEDYPPLKFTKVQKNGKEVLDCFFCQHLCGHKCHYLDDFLAEWEKDREEDDDLFG